VGVVFLPTTAEGGPFLKSRKILLPNKTRIRSDTLKIYLVLVLSLEGGGSCTPSELPEERFMKAGLLQANLLKYQR
jgi:hypothetical protein